MYKAKAKTSIFNNPKSEVLVETRLQVGREHRLAGRLVQAEKVFNKILLQSTNLLQAYFERSSFIITELR